MMNIDPTSSLRSSINKTYGPTTVREGIAKRTSTVVTTKYLSRLLMSYLDETTKSNYVDPMSMDGASPSRADRIVKGLAPQKPGVDYVPSIPGVQYCGYLKEVVRSLFCRPQSVSHAEVLDRVLKWWIEQREASSVKAIHMVFSLDPRHGALAGELGIPVDNVLNSAVADTFSAFNDRHYPDSRIGYMIGFHHDKHHTHAHALIYPVTSSGQRINLSNNALCKVNGEYVRIQFLSTVNGIFKRFIGRRLELIGALDPSKTKHGHDRMLELCAMTNLWLESPSNEHVKSWDQFDFSDAQKWVNTILDTSDSSAKIQDSMRKVAETESWVPVTREDLPHVIRRLEAVQSESETLLNTMRSERMKVAADFSSFRNSADRYRRLEYFPGAPGVSPSGSKQFLFESVTKDNPLPHGDRVWRGMADVLSARLARCYNTLDRVQDTLPRTPILNEETTNAAFQRGLKFSSSYGSILLERLQRAGVKDPAVDHIVPDDHALRSAETSRKTVSDRLTLASHEQAADHHTATADELILADRRLKLGRRLRDVMPAPEEVVFEKTVPKASSMIPDNVNFIEREAGEAGVRSLSDILRTETDKLMRLHQVLAWDSNSAILPEY